MCFFVLAYCKTYFSGLFCLKKKDGKMAIFRPKPWTNPFRKIPIFLLFQIRFYSLERQFFFLDYRETPFYRIFFPEVKRWENCEFLTKTKEKKRHETERSRPFFSISFDLSSVCGGSSHWCSTNGTSLSTKGGKTQLKPLKAILIGLGNKTECKAGTTAKGCFIIGPYFG